MAPRLFEPLSTSVKDAWSSRRGTKVLSTLASPKPLSTSIHTKPCRHRRELGNSVILALWTLSACIGLLILGSLFVSVDLFERASSTALDVTEAQAASLDAFPRIALEFWDFEEDRSPVHVIQTRFMQLQPHLVALGHARLEIFEAICLPTILAQSSKKFIWLIRADPDLDSSLKQALVELIRSYPNILLIGSNINPEGFRDHKSIADINLNSLWSGSLELLRRFHAEAARRTLIETRLDADDGLHYGFVEYMKVLVETELSLGENEWLIYCASSHLEWQLSSPFKSSLKGLDAGYLLLGNKLSCITPGLSYLYGPKVTRSMMPKGAHSHLHKKVLFCGDNVTSKCMRHMKDLAPVAIRARTPTSAGMANVVIDGTVQIPMNRTPAADADLQDEIWTGVQRTFSVSKSKVIELRRSLLRNMRKIVADNLKGQCTKGHSCKATSKQVLREMLRKTPKD